jgi:hypothetical protein
MKTFIHNLKLAFTQSELYQNPASFKLKGGLVHILWLSIILSIVSTIYVVSIALPVIKSGAEYGALFAEKFPEQLILTLKNNTLSMNVPSPFEISYKKLYNEIATSTVNLQEHQNRAENFIVIDTDHNVELATFDAYKTDMFLGKDGIISKDSSGSLRVNYYKSAKINELIISKPIVIGWNNTLQSTVKQLSLLIIIIISFIIIVLSTAYSYIQLLLASLLGAIIVKLVASVKGWKNFPYTDGLKIALYAITIKTIINLVGYIIPLPWFLTVALFTAIVVGFIPHKDNTITPETTEETPA